MDTTITTARFDLRLTLKREISSYGETQTVCRLFGTWEDLGSRRGPSEKAASPCTGSLSCLLAPDLTSHAESVAEVDLTALRANTVTQKSSLGNMAKTYKNFGIADN